MASGSNARLIAPKLSPAYKSTEPNVEAVLSEETELEKFQRQGKALYDNGGCPSFRGTFVCPVGGNTYAVVPQYLKDRVDGELGEQTHGNYPPPCLLSPGCAEFCETNTCCVTIGRIGDSGPCGEEQDPKEEKRHAVLSFAIVLTIIGTLLFVPVWLSVLDDQEVVESLYWYKATLKITGKRVWQDGLDPVGTISMCNEGYDPDPVCASIFSYKISPGGTLIEGPFTLLGKAGSSVMYAEYHDLSLCEEYMDSRDPACAKCKASMLLQGLAGFMLLSGLIFGVMDILARWDRKYDINFTKGSGILGALLTAPAAVQMLIDFRTNCVAVLLAQGTGEMARGSYQIATVGGNQPAALLWSIQDDAQPGPVTLLCVLLAIIWLVRALLGVCLPTDTQAGDPVKLTDPWDLGVENIDQYSKETRLTNTSHKPQWGKLLSGFTCCVGCCPNCAMCCVHPRMLLHDMFQGFVAVIGCLAITNILLVPCTKLCPWCIVHRPTDAPPPRAQRGVVRKYSCENGNCEDMWRDINGQPPLQEVMPSK